MVGEAVGNYRIISILGEGGMGVVYLAEHALIGRKAAVKMLRSTVSSSPDLVNRFFNEARTTSLIHHPGLVEIFDFGYHTSGSAFLIMEYLQGESLGDRLHRDKRLTPGLQVDIARQVAAALGAAHEKGVVHRDLKPDNLFLLAAPEMPSGVRVKVFDFGLAKLAWESANTMKTRSDAVMGTPSYMSPEQCRGSGQVDHRSDIYSLGCILFEAACGRPPFRGEGPGDLIAAHIGLPPPSPREFGAQIPPALEAVIARALAKRPDERYQTMAELSAGLDAAEMESALDALDLPTEATPSPTPDAVMVTDRVATPRRGRKVALFVGALAAAGAGTLFVVSGRHGSVASSVGTATASSATPPPPAPSSGNAVPVAPPAATPPAPPAPAVVAPAARVTLRVESRPTGAEVYRAADGIRLGRTPFVDERALSPGEAVYVVKRFGHREKQVALPADRDGKVMVNLNRLPGRFAAPSARAPGARPSRPVQNGVIDPFRK